ncbi:MAG: type IV pilus twitching motility protein PilT [Armatimonadetes bacterium]|nr:type IV pilus twitching motility protein PilT [Armatimonadota bacterium]
METQESENQTSKIKQAEEIIIEFSDNYTLDEVLIKLIEVKGSDFHCCVNSPPIFRINGDLVRLKAPIITKEKVESILLPLISEAQHEHHYKTGNLDFAYEIKGLSRFRANYFIQYYGMGAVFRTIPSKIPTIDDLRLPEVLKNISLFRRGMVVVTGPTGSGKSTTLAAMINYINANRSAHIITIEDPVEFFHTSNKCVIDHREIGDNAISFDDAIRASLREDPDIILVGEMRDIETVYQAIKAAETGLLVFATLHTNSAPKTIDRMIDVFPAKQQEQIRAMLSESLQAVIAQQLIKRSDKPGRVAANEIMFARAGLGNLIRERKTSMIANYIQQGREFGMQSMEQHLANFVKNKIISESAAKEKCVDVKSFEYAIKA